jgi:tRNA(fMet)-specific endonuclease VapC
VTVKYVLDTRSVSDAIKGRAPRLVARLRSEPRERVGVSAITAMELRFGLAKAPTLRNRRVVEEFLGTVAVLPILAEMERAYGGVRADLERRGCPIGPLDTIIAAHALSLGATLVTSNLREFKRVRGLRCVDWTTRSHKSLSDRRGR